MNKETIGSVVAVVLLAAGGWYVYSSGNYAGGLAAVGATDAVAIVNGEAISRGELDAFELQMTAGGPAATATAEKAALDQKGLEILIARMVLLQAAKSAGFTASTTEVDAQIAAAIERAGSQDALAKELLAQGLTEEKLRTRIGENTAIQAYLDAQLDLPSLTVSEDEIQATYAQFKTGQEDAPSLAQVHDQLEQFIRERKEAEMVSVEVDRLRAAGKVELLI
jgi:hypothetical protein